jgi:outer membrane protein assembly factor BamB
MIFAPRTTRVSSVAARTLAASLALALSACGAPATGTLVVRPAWTQYRLNGPNNPVLPGRLRVSWRVVTSGGISASPTLVGSTVYVGNNKGTLYAIDANSGHVRWTYRAHAPLMTNPLLWRGLVIVGEGDFQGHFGDDMHPTVVGSSTNSLFALDASNGALRWRVLLAGSGMPTPAIVGDVLVHHNGAGLISGLDPMTGRVEYTLDLISAASMSSIMPIAEKFFVTNGGALGFANLVTERSAADGALVWETKFPPEAWGFGDCPLAGDDKIAACDYVVPPRGSTVFQPGMPGAFRAYALNARDGSLLWDVLLEKGRLPFRNLAAVPLMIDRTLYVGSPVLRVMHAIDANTGRVRWRLAVRGLVRGGAVYKDGVLYFGDLAGYLWAVNARTGKPIGVKKMPVRFSVSSPIVAGETLIVGCRGGSVIAVPLDQIRSSHDA